VGGCVNGHWVAGAGHVRLRVGAVAGGGGDWDFEYKCGSCVHDGSEGSVAELRRPTFVLDQRGKCLGVVKER
jgi:hypothetical protein